MKPTSSEEVKPARTTDTTRPEGKEHPWSSPQQPRKEPLEQFYRAGGCLPDQTGGATPPHFGH